MSLSRRNFLKIAGSASSASVAAPMLVTLSAMQEAAAAVNGSGYKALVCVYLAGGNDAFNTVVPRDIPAEYNVYKDKRLNLYLSADKLLPLGTTYDTALRGQGWALNKRLTNLHSMYNSGTMAIVANVGPLLQASDKSTPEANRPKLLFSHNDQTSVWLTGDLEGRKPGWGGGIAGYTADSLVYQPVDTASGPAPTQEQAKLFRAISIDRQTAFCVDTTATSPTYNFVADAEKGVAPFAKVKPWHQSTDGIAEIYKPDDDVLLPVINGTLGETPTTHVLEQDYISVTKQAYQDYVFLKVRPAAQPPQEQGPERLPDVSEVEWSNPLLRQLNMVANIIKHSAELGVGRQVFYVELGGFDTHSGQGNQATTTESGVTLPNSDHDRLLAQVDQAIGSFFTRIAGHESKVTLFTASEFGRKLLQNGDGCDHGWGGHHFVVGGAVKGGQIYGRLPTLATTGGTTGPFISDQIQSDGTLVPEISVDQYAWPLASWFGVPESARMSLFPNYFPVKKVNGVELPLNFMNP